MQRLIQARRAATALSTTSSTSSAPSTCSSTSKRTNRPSRELLQAVVPGGGADLTVPQHPSLWSPADVFGEHERRYTRAHLVAKLGPRRLRRRLRHVVHDVAPTADGGLARTRPGARAARSTPQAEFRHLAEGRSSASSAFSTVERRAHPEQATRFPSGGSLARGGSTCGRSAVSHVPFNRALHDRARARVHPASACQRPNAGGQRAVRARLRVAPGQFWAARVLLTHFVTAALEMARSSPTSGPGDEVIVPSFTFVSTANAFVAARRDAGLRRHPRDTLNLDERARRRRDHDAHGRSWPSTTPASAARWTRSPRSPPSRPARDRGRRAGAARATYRGRPLGTLGDLAALSFHETKNVTSGEGGALLVNDARSSSGPRSSARRAPTAPLLPRRGRQVHVGRPRLVVLPWELSAAFLWAQLEHAEEITARGACHLARYHEVSPRGGAGLLRRPVVPEDCDHNAHIYYVLLRTKSAAIG